MSDAFDGFELFKTGRINVDLAPGGFCPGHGRQQSNREDQGQNKDGNLLWVDDHEKHSFERIE
jgi:hypothetical protein